MDNKQPKKTYGHEDFVEPLNWSNFVKSKMKVRLVTKTGRPTKLRAAFDARMILKESGLLVRFQFASRYRANLKAAEGDVRLLLSTNSLVECWKLAESQKRPKHVLDAANDQPLHVAEDAGVEALVKKIEKIKKNKPGHGGVTKSGKHHCADLMGVPGPRRKAATPQEEIDRCKQDRAQMVACIREYIEDHGLRGETVKRERKMPGKQKHVFPTTLADKSVRYLAYLTTVDVYCILRETAEEAKADVDAVFAKLRAFTKTLI